MTDAWLRLMSVVSGRWGGARGTAERETWAARERPMRFSTPTEASSQKACACVGWRAACPSGEWRSI